MTPVDTRVAEILSDMRRAHEIVRNYESQELREALLGVAPALRLVKKDEGRETT